MMMKTTFFMSTFFWNGFTSGVEKIWYTCINPFENWLSFSGQKSTLQNPWPANFCCFFYGRPWSCRRAPTISLCRSSSSTLPCLASKLTWVPRWTFRRTRCLEVCLRVRAVYAKCFCFVSEFKRSDPNPWSSSSLYIYIFIHTFGTCCSQLPKKNIGLQWTPGSNKSEDEGITAVQEGSGFLLSLPEKRSTELPIPKAWWKPLKGCFFFKTLPPISMVELKNGCISSSRHLSNVQPFSTEPWLWEKDWLRNFGTAMKISAMYGILNVKMLLQGSFNWT